MHPIAISLIICTLGFRNSVGLGNFDLNIILKNGDDRYLQTFSPLLNHHSVSTIRNYKNHFINKTAFMRIANQLKTRSTRSEILIISTLSLLNFINSNSNSFNSILFLFTPFHSSRYMNTVSRDIGIPKVIFVWEDTIFIPCFPCRTFPRGTLLSKQRIISFHKINSIWHRQKRDRHAGKYITCHQPEQGCCKI